MYMWLIGGTTVILLVLYTVFSDVRQLVHLGILVLRVQPYEQTVSGAPVILVAGDSTGYGTGATAGAKSVAGFMGADFPNYSIKNTSVNGRTIGGVKIMLESLPEVQTYELILLQMGGNDILQRRTVDEVEVDLRAALRAARARAKQVVMMSSGNVGAAAAFVEDGQPNQEYEEITRKMRTMFMQVADEEGVVYVDLFLEPNDDVFLKQPKKYLAIDGLHPSSEGYYFWYQSLKPVLEKRLK